MKCLNGGEGELTACAFDDKRPSSKRTHEVCLTCEGCGDETHETVDLNN